MFTICSHQDRNIITVIAIALLMSQCVGYAMALGGDTVATGIGQRLDME
jgi:hypothetical protein